MELNYKCLRCRAANFVDNSTPQIPFDWWFQKIFKDDARDLRKTEVPCRVIFTMRKLETVTPSLKPPIDREDSEEWSCHFSVRAAWRAMSSHNQAYDNSLQGTDW